IPEEPSAGHEAAAPGYDEDPWLDEDAADEVPADEALEHRPKPQSGESGDEDVLEETPDFLQETPEHDRLWFEQKPPRDFDWDKGGGRPLPACGAPRPRLRARLP